MVLLALLWGIVCFDAADAQPPGEKGMSKAVCVLHPTQGHKAHGTIWFTRRGGEIEITGEISGLTPGTHAFHVHEFGDCSSPDAMSAGGHFNPEGKKHGDIHARERHVGDLGNIKADGTGRAMIEIRDREIKLSGPHSIIGRGLIVHADADDFKTQPTGNAGGRVACGVIGVAKP
jgi:Cu-Zn family superoxide dismutase